MVSVSGYRQASYQSKVESQPANLDENAGDFNYPMPQVPMSQAPMHHVPSPEGLWFSKLRFYISGAPVAPEGDSYNIHSNLFRAIIEATNAQGKASFMAAGPNN